VPETALERRRHEEAQLRREMRLRHAEQLKRLRSGQAPDQGTASG
jgi:outer membrane lipopolysaccharide assembly protein LptE/RlpB